MTRFIRTLALAALVLALNSLGTAYGQYSVNVGAAPGGGNVVVGDGVSLGSIASGAILSAGGFDNLTFDPGSFAIGSGVDTVTFTTSNNTITVNGAVGADFGFNAFTLSGVNETFTIAPAGVIQGGAGTPDTGSGGGNGGVGITIFSTGADINGISITNHGLVGGGNGGDSNNSSENAGNGNNAIILLANFSGATSINGFGLLNTGNILGGNGGNGNNNDFANAGSGAYALEINANGSVTGVAINNSGHIIGGSGGNFGFDARGGRGADAIYVFADTGNITGVFITNSGAILGGNASRTGNANSLNTSFSGEGIEITADNAGMSTITITNSGLITGGKGGTAGTGNPNSAGGIAIDLDSDTTINFFTLTNSKAILGGDGGSSGFDISTGGAGGIAVNVLAAGDVDATILNNSGLMQGGAGGATGNDANGGAGGVALLVDSENGNVNAVTLMNSGKIAGGAGGGSTGVSSNGAVGGNGLEIDAGLLVTGINVTNTAGGAILGGNGGGSGNNLDGFGGNAGFGISVNSAASDINGFTLNNAGLIRGGNGGMGDDLDIFNGGVGGNGVILLAAGNIFNVAVNNSGSVIGGNGGNEADGDTALLLENSGGSISGVAIFNSGNFIGGNGGSSAHFGAGSGLDGIRFLPNTGGISNVSIFNSGNLIGGSGGDTGAGFNAGNGGEALGMASPASINNVFIVNAGLMLGGNAGISASPSMGGFGGDAVDVDAASTVSNFSLVNWGVIQGGSGNGGGDAVSITGGASSNIVVTNYGAIIGGNALNVAGKGVVLTTNGAVLNNWGVISGGAGGKQFAITVNGLGNTVNLNGHSAVINGLIAGSSPGPNNVLGLNFTGLSPDVQAVLVAQILAQGNPANFHGMFTVRGITYDIDPMHILFDLKSYQLQGQTPNQQAVGKVLDGLTFNPPPGTPLFNLLNAIDQSGNVPGALEALSPQKYEIYGDLAIQNSTAMVQNVDARLNNLRDGSESVDTTGIGGGVASGAIATGDPSKDGGGKETKEVVQPAPQENRWGFFATGDGLFFRANSRNVDLQEGKSNAAGTLAGVDGKVGDHGVIGALFAYNNADATLGSDGSHATIESYSGGLYGSYHQDGFYVNSLAAYTRNNYESMRNILIPGFGSAAGGSTNGNQATVNLDGGYDWHVTDRLTAGPIAGLQYVHLDVDGFNETGAGAPGLTVGSQGMDSLQSRVGGRLDYHIATTATSSFAAELYAAWEHEYLNDSRAINAGFENGVFAPFSIQTASPERDAAVVGLGLNFTFHDRLTLFTDYELQLWRASYFQQTINGGAKISF